MKKLYKRLFFTTSNEYFWTKHFFDFHAWVKKVPFWQFSRKTDKVKKKRRQEQNKEKKKLQEGPFIYYVSKGTGWIGGWAQKMASFKDVQYLFMLTQ